MRDVSVRFGEEFGEAEQEHGHAQGKTDHAYADGQHGIMPRYASDMQRGITEQHTY